MTRSPQDTVFPSSSLSFEDRRRQSIADSYDGVPYLSKPFAQSRPEQLAAMAKLFGLNAPDFREARVLELGCSAGGNLIPLAAKYAGVKALGIDVSPVQVEYGRALIQRAGITNCELRVMDIADAKTEIVGQFDFIICHGVFSWVPEHVRNAIFEILRDLLVPTGVAYVSYNVYPGWKMREVIRDLMLFHAGGLPTPSERLQQARAILDYAKDISAEQSTYGRLLRDEAMQVGRSEEHYLYHEHLSIENNPMYFREFMALAHRHKLTYLGESGLSDMVPQRLGKGVSDTLGMLSAGNILATEQYLDFFTNRTFRQTLLVHDTQVANINRSLGLQSVRDFCFSTNFAPDPTFRPSVGQLPLARYVDPLGRSLDINAHATRELIKVVSSAKLGSIKFADIVGQMKAAGLGSTENPDEAVNEAVAIELANLMLLNVIGFGLEQVVMCPISRKPVVFPLARAQVAMGQNWVTNLRHQSVELPPQLVALLPLLDGTRDYASLQAELAFMIQDGRVVIAPSQQSIADPAGIVYVAEQLCHEAVQRLQELMLLID